MLLEERAESERLRQIIKAFQRHRFGRRAESLSEDQLRLALEEGQFRWPKIEDGVVRLTAAELSALLEGLDWRRVHEPRQVTVPVAPS